MNAISFILIFTITYASLTYANGGNQKYVEGYLVQMSSLPISPFAGEKMSMLISFANTSSDLLSNLEGNIRINQNDRTIFKSNFTAPSGTAKSEYTFNEPGYYDMIVDFKFANESRVYMSDHFLIEVKPAIPWHIAVIAAITFLFGVVAGFIFGWRLKK